MSNRRATFDIWAEDHGSITTFYLENVGNGKASRVYIVTTSKLLAVEKTTYFKASNLEALEREAAPGETVELEVNLYETGFVGATFQVAWLDEDGTLQNKSFSLENTPKR